MCTADRRGSENMCYRWGGVHHISKTAERGGWYEVKVGEACTAATDLFLTPGIGNERGIRRDLGGK